MTSNGRRTRPAAVSRPGEVAAACFSRVVHGADPRLACSLMTPVELEGLVIGPIAHRVDRERVAAFVAVTGDDPERWNEHAPPGYAAALLFAVADQLLTDERIAPYLATLIHVDQQFAYPAPIAVGSDVEMTGTVQRVRERAGAFFVTLVAEGTVDGRIVLESRSTFLMSDVAAGQSDDEAAEPRVDERGENDVVDRFGPPTRKSASRADLVRYAAATGDFNPLHWDHDTAVAAGLPGVVVHGLLMFSWLAQAAVASGVGPTPIETVKVRFRSALPPAQTATIESEPSGTDGKISLRLVAESTDVVTGTAVVRAGAVTV